MFIIDKNEGYFFFKKGIESGYLCFPEFIADIIFAIVAINPYNKIAPVKKKFIPGKGKNRSNEIIKYKLIEQ